MHLNCTHCNGLLNVPEQYIGQQMSCPLCKGTFTVPATPESQAAAAPAPAPPPVPPAPSAPITMQPDTPAPPPVPPQAPQTPPPPTPQQQPAPFGFADEQPVPPPAPAPQPPPPQPFTPSPLPGSAAPPAGSTPDDFGQVAHQQFPQTPSAPPPAYTPTPEPPVEVGPYERDRTLTFPLNAISWVVMIGIVLLFILSFLPWVGGELSAWDLGFSDLVSLTALGDYKAFFIIYDLFLVFALLFGIASFLIHLKVIPDLPQLQAIKPLRSMIVGGLAIPPFLLLVLVSFIMLVGEGGIPYGFFGVLACWIHFFTVIALLLEIWMVKRGPSRPPIQIVLRS